MAKIRPSKPGGPGFRQMKMMTRPRADPVLGGNAALRPPRINPPGINSGFSNAAKVGGFKPSKPSNVPGIPKISTANKRSASRFGDI